MARKLASVQQVTGISPIEGADFIELAAIDGWRCVVKKGDFQVGDRAVYFEIDAVLPDVPVFQFLWQPSSAQEGDPVTPRPKNFRIRTKKLRGEISQGLLMPLSVVGDVIGNETIDAFSERAFTAISACIEEEGEDYLPPPSLVDFANEYGWQVTDENATWSEFAAALKIASVADFFRLSTRDAEDLSVLLGVTKYEPPVDNSGQSGFRSGRSAGNFPAILPKTDETRVQGVTSVLEELKGHPYVMTVKLDGTSATYLIDPRDGVFHACSRNYSIRRPEEGEEVDSVYWQMAIKYGIETKLRGLRRLEVNPHPVQFVEPDTVLLNDEGTGLWQQDQRAGYFLPKPYPIAIQGEIVGPSIQGNKLGLAEVEFRAFNVYDFNAGRYLGHAESAEILDRLEIPRVPVEEIGESFDYDLPTLLAKAEAKYPGTKNEREGLVVRSLHPMYSERLRGRMSFKAISNRFLLKGGD